jgi:hypothetical protein
MTKPTDVATTETSTIIAWWSTEPTILMFQGNIVPANGDSLAGRQVFETPNGANSDTCFHEATDAVLGYSAFHVTGSGWFVGYYYFGSDYYYDYVGMTPGLITYYRQKNRPPCEGIAPQAMNIYTRAGLGSVEYYTDTLYVNLPDDVNVGVARGGLPAGWRTYP